MVRREVISQWRMSMNVKLLPRRHWKRILLGASLLTVLMCRAAMAQPAPFIRLAELEIDHTQLAAFQAAARTHAEAALRVEPGLLALHAAVEKDQPHRIRVLEIYADAQAYRSHLQTPHFLQFNAAIGPMVRSRQLLDAVPVRLGSKPTLRPHPHVRIAELAIDPAQLQAYQDAVTEEIDASIRLEPGVLSIYSVALKDQPTQLRFFEIYADEAAYRQHIASPHFKKYVAITQPMITSRRLLEAEPVLLSLPSRGTTRTSTP